MSLWIVVGGQYGSEGKGKVAAFITLQEGIDLCIRCGGPNSGHSFIDDDGHTRLCRQLPTGYKRSETRLLIPAGGLIDLTVLRKELDEFGLDDSRVGIDRNAMIIEEMDKEKEASLGLKERLSSTLCGVGSAVARRALRSADVRLAKDFQGSEPWLRKYIVDVAAETNQALAKDKKVLVEGTQGFGLSLYQSDFYPKATSRDTTAVACLSEVGLSPRLVTEIVLVFRTFPIRVAGEQAGPLAREIDWEILQKESGYPYPIREYTSVTKKLRRIARFDWELARRAVMVNQPTRIAVNGLDYLNYANKGLCDWRLLDEKAVAFVRDLQNELNTPVTYCGTGGSLRDMFPLPGSESSQEDPLPHRAVLAEL